MNRRITYQQKGFTIVELLIVIVVIAILAAISIVAFNGIQDRARSANYAVAVDAYIKSLKVFKSTYDGYPYPNGLPIYGGACIGTDYPAAPPTFAAGQCGNHPDGYDSNANTDFNAKIEKQLGVKDVKIDLQYSAYANGSLGEIRGMIYSPGCNVFCGNVYSSGGQALIPTASIFYVVKGRNAQCPRGTKYADGSDATVCIINLD